jgi:hypothetical protein
MDSIPGKQTINVGLPNESNNSDSLYTAFTKTVQNFTTLFACASPYTTFTAGAGITASANAITGTVTITNTGVTSIVAGTNIVINQSNGAVTISSTGGGGGGGLTSVGLNSASSSRLVVSNSPLVTNGNMNIDLATTGVSSGTYTNPVITVDNYGRITSAVNGTVTGTVTSVGITAGPGIQVNGGPVTTNGNITVTNTGVTRINPGPGILVSSGNGSVTISAASLGGTVTSVGVASSTLTVSGSPVVNAGTINVNLPNNVTLPGNITVVDMTANGKIVMNGSEDLAPSAAVNLALTTSYFTTSGSETATLAAGTNGQIKTFMRVGGTGTMTITVTNAAWGGAGGMSFTSNGAGCILQYIASKWVCIGNNGVVFS